MKKQKKIEKLTLHRETLRSLTEDPWREDSLKQVEGGAATFDRSCILSCPLAC